jgi:hypothetical protein
MPSKFSPSLTAGAALAITRREGRVMNSFMMIDETENNIWLIFPATTLKFVAFAQ